MFLNEAIQQSAEYKMDDLTKLADNMVENARNNGKQKARETIEEELAEALRNGAGPAHKMTATDSELPPLRLVIRTKKANVETAF